MKSDLFLFRRQFVLCPSRKQLFPDWKHYDLPDGSSLSVHPDLPFTAMKRNGDYIALLGYILDPFNIYRDDKHIVREMLEKCRTHKDVFKYVMTTGGRYVLIVKLNGKRISFSDPAGFRQIFYMEDSSGGIWLVSQPSILAHIFNLTVDEKIETDLYRIPLFANGVEYWYPGTITAYSRITHLLPNHYLDFDELSQKRFWPADSIPEVSTDECLNQCAEILRGLYWSLENRYELSQTITAGIDSRLILAASRFVGDRIYYLTHTHSKLGTDGFDIVIPSRMLPLLGLQHNVVLHSEKIAPEFERIYRKNVTTARNGHLINAYAFHRHFSEIGKEMMVINGVCGEITRNYYYLPGFVSIDSRSLCFLTRMKESLLAHEQFDLWLQCCKNICKESEISILDLFYWEQRVGNWAAMSYSEYDIAFESFSPLNCRYLLQLMLSVKKNWVYNGETLQLALIKRLWPDILKFPINPSSKTSKRIIKGLKKTPLKGLIRTMKYLVS